MSVLVVDDDAGIRDVLHDALTDGGYTVLLAQNGQEAIEMARRHQPPVILMDLMMPVLAGVEAIRILKDDPATSWMRIVAMSAGVNLQRQTGQLSLADGILGKPFDLDVLLAQVQLRLKQATHTDADDE